MRVRALKLEMKSPFLVGLLLTHRILMLKEF